MAPQPDLHVRVRGPNLEGSHDPNRGPGAAVPVLGPGTSIVTTAPPDEIASGMNKRPMERRSS